MAVLINSVIPKTGVGRVLAVARAVGSRTNGMTRDAIASKLNLKAGTGSANNRVIAAKKFGVIETGRSGGYVLTELGRRLSVAEPSREDIVAAIRNVEAFAKLIDQTEGDPGDLAQADVRAVLKAAGVRADELDSATRVFIVSWSYKLPDALDAAGEVADGDDTGSAGDAVTEDEGAASPAIENAGPLAAPRSGEGTAFLDHQMVRWVLEQAPVIGDPWPAERYDAWSELLRTTIRFLYPDTVGAGA